MKFTCVGRNLDKMKEQFVIQISLNFIINEIRHLPLYINIKTKL